MHFFAHQKEALVRVLFSFHRDCIFYMPVLRTANSLSRTDARFCKYVCSLAITAVRGPAYESPVGHQKQIIRTQTLGSYYFFFGNFLLLNYIYEFKEYVKISYC